MSILDHNVISCVVCGRSQYAIAITHHTRRGDTTYVFENVPAWVCEQCGEVWIDGDVLHTIDELIDAGKVAPAPVGDYGRLVRV